MPTFKHRLGAWGLVLRGATHQRRITLTHQSSQTMSKSIDSFADLASWRLDSVICRSTRSPTRQMNRFIFATEYPANGSLTFHHARSVSSRASEKNIYGQASRLISIGKLNASPRLYTRPIDLVIFQEPLGILRSREISSCGGFHAYMLSAFLPSGRSYPALPLAR